MPFEGNVRVRVLEDARVVPPDQQLELLARRDGVGSTAPRFDKADSASREVGDLHGTKVGDLVGLKPDKEGLVALEARRRRREVDCHRGDRYARGDVFVVNSVGREGLNEERSDPVVLRLVQVVGVVD